MEVILCKKIPNMAFNIRISTDSSGKERFTEDEINKLVNDGMVLIRTSKGSTPLLVRKVDYVVLGEII